jgi:hypothetical protein
MNIKNSEDLKELTTTLVNLYYLQGFLEATGKPCRDIQGKIKQKHNQLINLLYGDEEQ